MSLLGYDTIANFAAAWEPVVFIGIPMAIVLFLALFFVSRYRRCPPDRLMVVYGKIEGNQSSMVLHGGGVIVWPVIQDCQFLSLEPMDFTLREDPVINQENVPLRLDVHLVCAISTEPARSHNAAERLLGLSPEKIIEQAREIAMGQLRQAAAASTTHQMVQEGAAFEQKVQTAVQENLAMLGLDVVSLSIRKIWDDNGCVEAIRRQAVDRVTAGETASG